MRRAAAILATTALVACAGARPEIPDAAAVSPPAAWRTDPGAAPSGVNAAWWQGFGDPALTRVVETALAHNDDIAIAAERVAEARGRFRFAVDQRLPSVAGVADGGRQRDVNPGFGIPENQTLGEAEASASFDADLFGRLREASRAARSQLLASEAARDNVRLAVAASAAGGYISLRALDARLDVLRRTLAQRGESLRVIRRRAQTGYSSQLDLAQAEADYRAAEQLIPAAQLALARQEDGLSIILGNAPDAVARGADLDQLVLPQVPVSVPAQLMRRRPDIIAAEEQLVAADHALSSARAAFLPDIRISADGGLQGSTLISSPVQVFTLAGGIFGPIFDAGRLDAQQDTVAAQRNEAAFAYRKTALNAFREVEDALAAVRKLGEQEHALNLQHTALSRARDLAANRYRSGYSPYLDQLDAERSLLATELAQVQTHADRLTAAVALYQSLGGGWEAPKDKRD